MDKIAYIIQSLAKSYKLSVPNEDEYRLFYLIFKKYDGF
jgi:hypothetical protein